MTPTIAAAEIVLRTSHFHVSLTQPLELDSGSRHFLAPQKAVAVKVKIHLEFILKATGVVTSPNHPDYYPDNLDNTEIIEVESEKILRLEFTHFVVLWQSSCQYDFVKITDGDGTTLMDRSCGTSSVPSHPYYFLPPIITTRSNRVEIFFHTSSSHNYDGWSLSWSAVTPGEKDLFPNLSIY